MILPVVGLAAGYPFFVTGETGYIVIPTKDMPDIERFINRQVLTAFADVINIPGFNNDGLLEVTVKEKGEPAEHEIIPQIELLIANSEYTMIRFDVEHERSLFVFLGLCHYLQEEKNGKETPADTAET